MKRTAVLTAIALALSGVALLYAEERMRPGMWETTNTFQGNKRITKHCFTAADLEESNAPVAALRGITEKALAKAGNGSCKIKDFKVDRTVIWSVIACEGYSIENTTTYSSDAFETTVATTKGGVVTHAAFSSRRVGSCQ
jgi:Protein of unknown function (DUF3617)